MPVELAAVFVQVYRVDGSAVSGATCRRVHGGGAGGGSDGRGVDCDG